MPSNASTSCRACSDGGKVCSDGLCGSHAQSAAPWHTWSDVIGGFRPQVGPVVFDPAPFQMLGVLSPPGPVILNAQDANGGTAEATIEKCLCDCVTAHLKPSKDKAGAVSTTANCKDIESFEKCIKKCLDDVSLAEYSGRLPCGELVVYLVVKASGSSDLRAEARGQRGDDVVIAVGGDNDGAGSSETGGTASASASNPNSATVAIGGRGATSANRSQRAGTGGAATATSSRGSASASGGGGGDATAAGARSGGRGTPRDPGYDPGAGGDATATSGTGPATACAGDGGIGGEGSRGGDAAANSAGGGSAEATGGAGGAGPAGRGGGGSASARSGKHSDPEKGGPRAGDSGARGGAGARASADKK